MSAMAERDPVEELAELLTLAGAVPTLDSGRNSTYPCTFCGTPASRALSGKSHDLVTIGRYPTGAALTRPVCKNCLSTGRIFEKMIDADSNPHHAPPPLPALSRAARGILNESAADAAKRARDAARAARRSYLTGPLQRALGALAAAHDEAAEVYESFAERVRRAP